MGSSQSSQPADNEDEDDEEEEEDHHPHQQHHDQQPLISSFVGGTHPKDKVLEQEPEILPCYASASPLSAVGTPRAGPHIKVWDPCHVLLPPPPPLDLGLVLGMDLSTATEVFLIAHGECALNLRPDLVTGRCPAAGLTGNGEQQARALAVFLKSQGVRFSKVYSSPLDRAIVTAGFVCRELGFATEQIETSNELVEMSQGQWEGCLRSETYTPEILTIIGKTLPDFSPPSGESLRQVEFRMIEFLNKSVLKIPEMPNRGGFSRQSSTSSVQEKDGQWDLMYRLNHPGLQRKKSGKSRLQFVTTGENETEEDFLPSETRSLPNSIGIFTHSTPIKCLVAGVLGAGLAASQKFCIDDSSATVVQYSMRTGWQIKRLNDTSHLSLL